MSALWHARSGFDAFHVYLIYCRLKPIAIVIIVPYSGLFLRGKNFVVTPTNTKIKPHK